MAGNTSSRSARPCKQHGIKNFSPANPVHLWKLRGELGAYAKWSLGQQIQITRHSTSSRI